MAWSPQLTDLRNRLATLFPKESDARLVVEEAQLDPVYIELSNKAITNWHSILSQAQLRNKVEAIVQAATNQFDNDVELRVAFQAYLKAEGRSPSIPSGQAPEQAPVIKILFLAANPRDTEPLNLDAEVRAIDDALRRANYRDRFELESQWAVRSNDLQELLLRYKPHIVHFAGHGDETGQLMLMDVTGMAKPVSPEALASLFAILTDNIRCVVLNACYTDTLAQGIARSVDFVLGMSQAFEDKAAIEFAEGFYTGLGFGRTVKVAFEMGKNRIGLGGTEVSEPPQLVALRSDPAKVILGINENPSS